MKNIMIITLLAISLWSSQLCAAAYDPKPISYKNSIVDTVDVRHNKIAAGVDDFIIIGKKGRNTEKFVLTCYAKDNQLNIRYYLKGIYGDNVEGATGVTVQYYPDDIHQMNNNADHAKTLMDSLHSANLAKVISNMLDYRTGSFVFHFYYNDGTFDHNPMGWSYQYPATLLAKKLGQALIDANARHCDIKRGYSSLSALSAP
ncbi:hypothetical protein [Pectobacterium actinidiae]|uniref:hypothetical protein n=1 Tax=Pectobacterium actinidiae TaxID=1507808 RepID=UPI0005735000|nr:hypothetical protein [Pectobacterium actinidiae]KHN92830.1 hypothetical protein KKH3_28570 [Pectobacterium actinidiae]ONK05700.1 hypothetical protein BSK69_06150 [Pectobacterium actinidiae]